MYEAFVVVGLKELNLMNHYITLNTTIANSFVATYLSG